MVPPATVPQLRVLLICDLTESPSRDAAAEPVPLESLRAHDALVRRLLRAHGGSEIDRSDGFLLVFEHPIRAVAFALAYLDGLGRLEAGRPALAGRVGIHVGDVRLWASAPEDIAQGAKPVNVEGVAKPIAARLMQLAPPGRALLSGVAATLARRSEAELHALGMPVRWHDHGAYRFKGIAEPMPVHEVALATSPAPPPRSTPKAERILPWWRARRLWATAALVLVAAGVAAIVAGPREAPLPFNERDWVVIGSLANSSADPRLDASLETGLRVALEQSPHINVLPAARVDDALQRMGLAPEAPIDRSVGSELAIREGARAVVLPSVFAAGERLQVSLELVDPRTQRTVSVEVAEGHGGDAAFQALEQVGRQLRRRLGEALRSIDRYDEPLAQVATSSLDALRAYSLGQRAFTRQEMGRAEQLFRQAVMLDPEFAAAYVALARLEVAEFDRLGVQPWLEKALEFRGKLSERERQHLEAWVMRLDHEPGFVERWEALLETYPDFHEVAWELGLANWYANRYEAAADYFERAAAAQSPIRATATYQRGRVLLALGRIEETLEHAAAAEALGITGVGNIVAGAHAARRDFAQAKAVLADLRPARPAVARVQTVMALAVAVDAGDRTGAATEAARLREGIAAIDALSRIVSQVVLSTDDEGLDASALAPRVLATLAEVRSAEAELIAPVDIEAAAMAKLIAVFGLARLQAHEEVDRVLEETAGIAARSPFGILSDMRALVEAQALLRDGRHAAAIAKVEAMLDGEELYLAHAVLMDAQLMAGRRDLALAEAQWLEAQRGRGYIEWAYRRLTLVVNVVRGRAARALLDQASG